MEFYTAKEVAEQLKLSELTVYDLIKKGEIEAVKIGRVYRISKESFEKFIEKSKYTNQRRRGRKPTLELPI